MQAASVPAWAPVRLGLLPTRAPLRAFRSPPRGRSGGPAAAGAALLEGLRGALAVVSQEYIHEYTQEYTQEYIYRRIHRSIYMTFNSFILQNFADFFLQEPQLKEETQLKRIEETQLKLEMNQFNLLSVFKCREQHVCIHTCMQHTTPPTHTHTYIHTPHAHLHKHTHTHRAALLV